MNDTRNQRAAVRLIKAAATRAGLTRIVTPTDLESVEDAIAADSEARAAHHEATTDTLVRGTGRTCANCAQSVSNDPKCGVCAGPDATTTRWEPLKKVFVASRIK